MAEDVGHSKPSGETPSIGETRMKIILVLFELIAFR